MDRLTLTDRQKQILCLACYTNGDIARILNIAHSTVKNHFNVIYKSLGLGGVLPTPRARRTVAITTALRHGIIALSEIALGDVPEKLAWDEFGSDRR